MGQPAATPPPSSVPLSLSLTFHSFHCVCAADGNGMRHLNCGFAGAGMKPLSNGHASDQVRCCRCCCGQPMLQGQARGAACCCGGRAPCCALSVFGCCSVLPQAVLPSARPLKQPPRTPQSASVQGSYRNLAMNGQEVFKFAVRAVPNVSSQTAFMFPAWFHFRVLFCVKVCVLGRPQHEFTAASLCVRTISVVGLCSSLRCGRSPT